MTLAPTHMRCHNENGPGGAGHTHRDLTYNLHNQEEGSDSW